jgi:hypothetical protein
LDLIGLGADVMRNGFVFTNQQLVLQHFAAIVSGRQLALAPFDAASFAVSFFNAVRHVPDDRKQVAIDKSLCRACMRLRRRRCG